MSLAVLSDSASDSSESANCGGDSGGGGGCDSELLCQPCDNALSVIEVARRRASFSGLSKEPHVRVYPESVTP